MAQQGGNALPDNLRTYMEPRFGLDFGRVRMHTDAEAAGLSQSLVPRLSPTKITSILAPVNS